MPIDQAIRDKIPESVARLGSLRAAAAELGVSFDTVKLYAGQRPAKGMTRTEDGDDQPCLTLADLKEALADDDRKVKKRLALCRVLHYLSEFGATVLRGDSPLGDDVVEAAYARACIRVMDRLSRPL